MEAEFVEWLRQRIGQHPAVSIGIGDDAAQVEWSSSSLVVATDLLSDGVHFRADLTPPPLIGRKAMGVNLSDFAAMAAIPQFAVVSLLWPRQRDWRDACLLYEGMLDLADQYRVAIVGGDTNRSIGPLAINVTLFGRPTERGLLTRDAAQPGDAILVTGDLGGSLSGHHLAFEPRVNEAIALHESFELHAAMDITDGLLIDLQRITQASGVGAELSLDSIPIAAAATQMFHQADAPLRRTSPLEHALTDGEDFELLLTTTPEIAERIVRDQPIAGMTVHRIGTIIPQPGIYERHADGQRRALNVAGYLH